MHYCNVPVPEKLQEAINKIQSFAKEKIIIFVKTRRTAKVLCEYLMEKLPELHPKWISGIATMNGQTRSQQKEIMKAFKEEPSFRLIVATSVLEEGIDIPECKLVGCILINDSSR